METHPSSKEETLKNFMTEFFPFKDFKQAGIFTKEMKGDYQAQAKKICNLLGLKTIYEYRSEEIRCHISYVNPDPDQPFVTVVPSIWN